MDWMTLIIEIVGIAIICIWIVVPVQEFRGIMNRIRQKPDRVEPTRPAHSSGEHH